MLVAVWAYEVLPGSEPSFEVMYGPDGPWAALFRRDPSYLGTDLMRDAERPGRYLTVDRWSSRYAYDDFLRRNRDAYDELDARGARLTRTERRVGAFVALEDDA